MPSSYTSNLGIELPANGEQDGVWGETVNDNMSIVDRAINGSVTLSLSGTASTLTTLDGTLSDGQFKLLTLGGTPSGTHTITIAPNDAQKIYFVRNTTAQSVIFTQGSGGSVTIATGDSGVIFSNGAGAGAAVVNITNDFAMSSVKITGGSVTGITDLALADGGTGASDAATARTNLGLGTIATQSAASVAITGGTITGITDLAVAAGGTGASDAATARTNLGAQATITGAATTITSANLTVSRALASDGSGKVAVSAVTATELGFLSGVTSGIQTQLNAKAALVSPALTGTPTAPTAAVGTNTTQLATTAFANAAAALRVSFTSTNQTITSAGLLTLAHGLGEVPKIIFLELVCEIAQHGYSIGDVIMTSVNNTTTNTSTYSSAFYDATNIFFRFSSAPFVFTTGVKTTGGAVSLVNTNWRLRVRAFA